MKRCARQAATAFLLILVAASFAAGWITPHSYETQDRDHISEPPSTRFLLGTDELGRDRMARLLYGTRVSLSLAPAAALLTCLLAALLGGAAGLAAGWVDRVILTGTDIIVSMPWFFLLIMVRAALPLNAPPAVSALITFLLLGLLGWAHAARVVRSTVSGLRDSAFVLQARASGITWRRILWSQILPNVLPVLGAQFWISVPVFIVTEANLGLLGLGVSEPMPSWGGLLRELESLHNLARSPWLLAPVLVLVLAVTSMQAAFGESERA